MYDPQYLFFRRALSEVGEFSELAAGLRLRAYQSPVARAIAESVIQRQGRSIVVMFPRQSGKNETQAQVEAYLLMLYSQFPSAEIVKASPTWKPQSLNAMRRLERTLKRNLLTRDRWRKREGFIFQLGEARIFFLSGAPQSQIVGATASLLLEVDEAQDVPISKYDKDLAPMAASTNATRVFWGTAWTSKTLLARELRAAQAAEKKDGLKRVFCLTADDVAREVPAYGQFVAEQVAKLGRNHPLVKTQFFSEEIDAEGGLFPPARRALMRGLHPPACEPSPGHSYAFLIDVAGEDETSGLSPASGGTEGGSQNTGRDSTFLTIVDVDLASLADPLTKAPTYRVVQRQAWTGVKHSQLFSVITALASLWSPVYTVIDATGIGAGLASFLAKALGEDKVLPYIFTQKSKSDLGWGFLAVVETGRFKDYLLPTPSPAPGEGAGDGGLQALFNTQLEHVQYSTSEAQIIRWSVPDGARHPLTGQPVHDDAVLSAALCWVLDAQEWASSTAPLVVRAKDPLADMDKEGF
jgi:hypothetical protein